jgi:hypothetical protein
MEPGERRLTEKEKWEEWAWEKGEKRERENWK